MPCSGPPESGWVGGARDSGTDGHAARGGHAIRARRAELLPALHAVQSRIGWISTPALNYVCKRLAVAPAEAYGVATFYALFATTPRPPLVAHVCDDIACRLAGAEGICADLTRAVGAAGEPIRTAARRGCAARAWVCAITRPRSCSLWPARRPRRIRSRRSTRSVSSPGSSRPGTLGRAPRRAPILPQPATDRPHLLARIGVVDPTSLDDYRAHGGYAALERAFAIGADAVIAEVTASS